VVRSCLALSLRDCQPAHTIALYGTGPPNKPATSKVFDSKLSSSVPPAQSQAVAAEATAATETTAAIDAVVPASTADTASGVPTQRELLDDVFGKFCGATSTDAVGPIDDPLELEFDLNEGFESTISKMRMLREKAQSVDDEERRQIAAHVSLQFAKMLGLPEHQ